MFVFHVCCFCCFFCWQNFKFLESDTFSTWILEEKRQKLAQVNKWGSTVFVAEHALIFPISPSVPNMRGVRAGPREQKVLKARQFWVVLSDWQCMSFLQKMNFLATLLELCSDMANFKTCSYLLKTNKKPENNKRLFS